MQNKTVWSFGGNWNQFFDKVAGLAQLHQLFGISPLHTGTPTDRKADRQTNKQTITDTDTDTDTRIRTRTGTDTHTTSLGPLTIKPSADHGQGCRVD